MHKTRRLRKTKFKHHHNDQETRKIPPLSKYESIEKFLSQHPLPFERSNSFECRTENLPILSSSQTRSPRNIPSKSSFKHPSISKRRYLSPDFKHSPTHFLPTSPNFVRKLATANEFENSIDERCSREYCLDEALKKTESKEDFFHPKFLGKNREKVSNLVEWLNIMKEKYLNSFFESDEEDEENLELAESIIKLGLNEVLQEVTLQCFERGEVLKELIELESELERIFSNKENSNLKNKIVKKRKKLVEQKEKYEKINEELKKELDESAEFTIWKDLQLATKSEEIAELKLELSKVETEKEFLLTTEITLYDEFNEERGTASFQELLKSDSIHNFQVRKNYRYSSKPTRPTLQNHSQMRLQPTYSKQMNTKDLEILDPFFVSRETQVEVEVLHKSIQKYIEAIDKNIETEAPEENISFISYGTSIVSDESIDPDLGGVPNAIIVTTDTQETIVEYAFLPSKELATTSSIRKINTINENSHLLSLESPPVRRFSVRSMPRNSDVDSVEPSSFLLPVPELVNDSFNHESEPSSEDSEISEFQGDISESQFGLSIPDQMEPSIELPRRHSLNPNPFTFISPIEIAPLKKKKNLVKKKHFAVETEKDLVLENEEIEILDEMIEWKQELLAGVDQELVRAKSKLTRVTQKNAETYPEEVEKEDLPEDLDEYLNTLRENGELTVDMDSFSWKGGFVHGLAKAHKFNGDVVAFAQNEDPKRSPRTPTRTEPERGKSLTKFNEFNFHQPENRATKKKSHPEPLLLATLSKQSNIEKYSTLTKKMLFKKLFLIYSAAMAREENGEYLPCLSEYVYNYIQGRHQENLIGDKKYLEFIASAIKVSDVPRIEMFIRLVGIGHLVELEDYIRPDKSFGFYIELLSSIFRSKVGIVVSYHDTGDVQYIPKNRAIECIKESFGDMFSSNYLVEMIRAIDKTSKADPLKINKSGVVSEDFVLELAMNEFEKHSRDVSGALTLLTQGFDLEKKGYIHATEFVMIIRHLVPEHLENVLNNNEYSELVWDYISMGKEYILVADLVDLCIRRSFISMEDVRGLNVNVPPTEMEARDTIKSNLVKYNDVILEVSEEKEKFRLSDEAEELWRSKIELLNTELKVNPKSLILAFTLFFQELDRLKLLLNS